MKRRDFLARTIAGAGALASAPYFLGAAGIQAKKLKKYGYIAGIVGKELKEDWRAALKKTAEMGYSEIETGNYYGDSAAEFLAYLKDIGMNTFAGGTKITADQSELKKSLENLQKLNVDYAVVYWPWLVGAPFKLEDCKRSSEILNKMGETCKQAGMTLCWHNHDREFHAMEEGLPFDYLMNHTDPELVKCEMDLYWVKKGGADPLAMLKKYPGRYPILHVKDMAPGPEQDFECVGSGIIDFPSIFAEAQKQGIRHYMVERDKAVDGMACLKSSAEYLKNLKF